MSGKKKNVFVIPSWYPTGLSPLNGIFIKEQVEALSRFSSDRFRYIVSFWGCNDSIISFRNLKDAGKKINWFRKRRRNYHFTENEVHYIEAPYLKISSAIPYFGHFNRLLNVQLKCIKESEKLFGKVDIIHAHVSYPAGYLAHVISERLGIPYVITEHMGPFPFEKYQLNGKPIEEIEQAMNDAFGVIAVSEALADEITSKALPRPFVIPNLVNEELFKPSLLRTKNSPFCFFTLASMEKAKGIQDLLNAIAIWRPDPEKVHFILGGEGADKNEFIKLAETLNISNYISWIGAVSREDATSFFNKCDAFVLPSHHESFGIVYAEAIACGKPVIATSCGGPESIIHENNGILVPVKDPEKLANALQWMVNNHSQYDSVEIRKDFEQRFSRNAVVSQITALYEKLLNKKNPEPVIDGVT